MSLKELINKWVRRINMAGEKRGTTVAIDDAMNDMMVNGEDGFGAGTVAPPRMPDDEYPVGNRGPEVFQPNFSGEPYRGPVQAAPRQSEPDDSQYFFITYNEDAETTNIEVLTEAEAEAKIEELTIAKAQARLTSSNPAHWHGRYLVIKGKAVVPQEVRMVKFV
jgi:hypothetical protein